MFSCRNKKNIYLATIIWSCGIPYDVQHMKRALMHIENVGPDQCAHLCSLIWAFSVRGHILGLCKKFFH